MDFIAENRLSLHAALASKNWFWENERFYPPNKTFWMEGDDPPASMIPRMYERMKNNLEKLVENKPYHLSSEQHRDWVDDMKILVESLQEIKDSVKQI